MSPDGWTSWLATTSRSTTLPERGATTQKRLSPSGAMRSEERLAAEARAASSASCRSASAASASFSGTARISTSSRERAAMRFFTSTLARAEAISLSRSAQAAERTLNSRSPSLTRSPIRTSTFSTRPGSGALSEAVRFSSKLTRPGTGGGGRGGASLATDSST